MPSSIGLAAARQLVATTLATSSARAVVLRRFAGLPASTSRFSFKIVRAYAAATVTKRKPAAKGVKNTSTAAKKPAAKKTTTTAKKTTKAKAGTRTRTSTKAKTKTKPKAKVKTRAKAKSKAGRKPSPETLALRQRRELRKKALYTEPKTLAERPWPLYLAEQTKGQTTDRDSMHQMVKDLAQQYKTLPASQIQRLRSTAEQNKSSNAAAYKTWVESHTPEEINSAIYARRLLKAKYNFPKGFVKPIRDERQPKRALTAYLLFAKAKWASGELRGQTDVTAVAKSLGQEWKALSEADRRPYVELAKAEMDRYEKDVASQLHREVQHGH
ncbi:hypothetical protein F5X99DRAFT_381554 [Biscogniauxia marginata]|nr:hypothetical protein F5X99DRAFT_381554 [Biscogniauxia marginata]